MKTPSVSRSKILFALALVYVVWGSTYLAIRVAVETLPPFLLAALRFLIAGGGLYLFLRLRGGPPPTRDGWRSATIVGAFLLLGGNGLVVWAERTVPSGLAALLVSTVPLWMAMADWAQPGGRRPSAVSMAGIVLGFVGLVVLVAPTLQAGEVSFSGGVFALLLAAPSWAIGSVYARRAPLPPSPFMATACEMLGGGAVLLLVSILSGEPWRLHPAGVTPESWASLAYLIVFGSLVGFTAYVWLLTNTSLAVASTYAYVNPVVAVLLGWAILGEPLGFRTAVGGAIIVSAVALISLSVRPAGESCG